jgi:hypothetical protein
MNDLLAKRIMRKLETLPDERVYQVLDYIEFLESKFAERTSGGSPFQKLAETVEDTLRAGKVGMGVVRGTMDAVSAAGRLMEGLAAAGKTVIDQVAGGGPPAPPPRRIEDKTGSPPGGTSPGGPGPSAADTPRTDRPESA